MNYLGFIASIIDSAVWPTVVIVSFLLFRNPIAELISKIKKIGTDGGLGIEIEDKVKELRDTLEPTPPSSETEIKTDVPNQAVAGNLEQLVETVARVSPTSAVIVAWATIETKLALTGAKLNVNYPTERWIV